MPEGDSPEWQDDAQLSHTEIKYDYDDEGESGGDPDE